MFKDIQPPEIDQVMGRAQDAFLQYRRISGTLKAAFLEAIASEIEGLGPALIAKAMEETNLPEVRLIGERGRTCNQLRQFASLVKEGSWVEARWDTALPDRTPRPKLDTRKIRSPLGLVVVFSAST